MSTSYETNAEGVNPGDIKQLMLQAPADMTLKGFIADHGLVLQWFTAGPTRVKPDDPSQITFGQQVKAKAYITAMVKNVTDKPIIGKGVWFVEGQNLPKASGMAQPMTGVIPLAKKPTLAGPQAQAKNAATGGRATGRITSYPVGRNELAIAMTHGEAKRLLDAICGGSPIMGTERPSYQRRFNTAFAIFGGSEPIPTLEEEPIADLAPEKETAYQDAILAARRDTETARLKLAEDLESLNKEVFDAGYERAMADMSDFAIAKLKTAYVDMQIEAQQSTRIVTKDGSPFVADQSRPNQNRDIDVSALDGKG